MQPNHLSFVVLEGTSDIDIAKAISTLETMRGLSDEERNEFCQPYLSANEISEITGVHYQTVCRWLREGRIAGAKLLDGNRDRWRVPTIGVGEYVYDNYGCGTYRQYEKEQLMIRKNSLSEQIGHAVSFGLSTAALIKEMGECYDRIEEINTIQLNLMKRDFPKIYHTLKAIHEKRNKE